MSTLKATYLQHMGSPDPNITLDNTGGVTFNSGVVVSGDSFFDADVVIGGPIPDLKSVKINTTSGLAVNLFPSSTNPSGAQQNGLIVQRPTDISNGDSNIVQVGRQPVFNVVGYQGDENNFEPLTNGFAAGFVYFHGYTGTKFGRAGFINCVSAGGARIVATTIQSGGEYIILTSGTTDFTTFGAADSNPGTTFTATTAGTGGSGDGTVQFTDVGGGNMPTSMRFFINSDRRNNATAAPVYEKLNINNLDIRTDFSQLRNDTLSTAQYGFTAVGNLQSSGAGTNYQRGFQSSIENPNVECRNFAHFATTVGGATYNTGTGITATGHLVSAFYSNMDTSQLVGSGQIFATYNQGDAPSYFGGTIRTGQQTNPGGTSSAGSTPENNDQNFNWTTQSDASNAVRIRGGSILISRYSTTASAAGVAINRLGSTTGQFTTFKEDGNAVDSIYLDGGGGIIYGTGASDYRLKENIVDLPSAVDTIKSLRPVNYNYKDKAGKTRAGFIAHELAESNIPFAVFGEKDATKPVGTVTDYDGTVLETNVPEPEELTYEEQVIISPYVPAEPEEGIEEQECVCEMITRTKTWEATSEKPDYQTIDQSKLIPYLTKALQEALDRIEVLEGLVNS